ncbi:hypothetical protein E2C01_046381 [Portunus trituberculatus]|uniref:Uncharacterized protein n=1 Tax=Portunus trituberculatus TaxID=210409 RepID=A0A5B7FXQ9_PORTR|nr:hypothetical protein [Portunus trituberculatus]
MPIKARIKPRPEGGVLAGHHCGAQLSTRDVLGPSRRYQTAIIGRLRGIKLRLPGSLKSGKIRVKNREPVPVYQMEHQEMEEDGRLVSKAWLHAPSGEGNRPGVMQG